MSRNTIAKQTIFEIIENSNTALSHVEIQNALNGLCDRVTTYRVLDRLLEAHKIHKVIDIDGLVKYASCHDCVAHDNHYHVHFSCQHCKNITCLEDIKPKFNLPANYQVHDMNFTISGICPQCA